MKLIVREAFGSYTRGEAITDEDAIEFILASENAQHVIPTAGEDE
jgi:hypothetical protein